MFSSVKQFLPEKKETSNRLFDFRWKKEMSLEILLVGRRALCHVCGYYRLVLTFRWLKYK